MGHGGIIKPILGARQPISTHFGLAHAKKMNIICSMSMTPADIIDMLGGPTAVSAACGEPVSTVRNWKMRQSIPARHHKRLLDLSRRTGVDLTADQFVDAHAEPDKKSA